MIGNYITVAITAAKIGNNAKVFEVSHVVNNYSKVQMNISPKLGSFQKNGRQIRNEWRQIYLLKRIHRKYNNFFQGGN